MSDCVPSERDPDRREAHMRPIIASRAAGSAAEAKEPAPRDFSVVATEFHKWTLDTFGPAKRPAGQIDHIRKELLEIEADPTNREEWIDVILIALDGLMRLGATAGDVVAEMDRKLAKNRARTWPDWRTAPPGAAIEHVRHAEPRDLAADTATAKAALDSYLAGKTDSRGFPVGPRSCGRCVECQTDSEPTLCPQGPPKMPRHAVCACAEIGCPEARDGGAQ